MKESQPIFSKTARTATTSATMACASHSGLFFINVTAVTATPSVVFTLAGVTPCNEGTATYTILTSAAITGTGLTVLRVCPTIAASANLIAQDMLPSSVKVTATHADADSITYEMWFVGTDD